MKGTLKPTSLPWGIVGDELHLLGTPMLCLGYVRLQNQSAEKVRIKRIPLAASKLTGPVDVPVSHLQLFARLLPGAALQAPVRLLIPPQTPPGKYSAEALVGNVRKSVIVDVLESRDLRIIPEDFHLKLHAHERAVRTVQLTNHGNMPWRLRQAALVPLVERDGVHRNISLSLRNTREPAYENVLNDFVKRMQDTEVGPAKIKIVSDADVLGPGESQNLELDISLPDNLKKNRRYTGKMFFENARLLLDIEILENSGLGNKE
jgi:hypothetical protein